MVGKALVVVADIVGWGYFLSWTISYLPQIYENFRRKSVIGFSFDMTAYFMLSYITYFIYNAAVYFDVDIQKQIIGDSDQSNPVKLTDFIFASFGLVCTFIQCIQILIYDRGSQRLHTSTGVACVLVLAVLGVLSVLAYCRIVTWLFVLEYCGYVKLVVSFGTYLPQIWLNYKRKSTAGYHIGGVLLDYSGGILSLLQMDLYCFIEHSNEQLFGNIPKMALGIVTLLFNIILIMQHYVAYMGNSVPEVHAPINQGEEHGLIDSSEYSKQYHSINDMENNGIQNNASDKNVA